MSCNLVTKPQDSWTKFELIPAKKCINPSQKWRPSSETTLSKSPMILRLNILWCNKRLTLVASGAADIMRLKDFVCSSESLPRWDVSLCNEERWATVQLWLLAELEGASRILWHRHVMTARKLRRGGHGRKELRGQPSPSAQADASPRVRFDSEAS